MTELYLADVSELDVGDSLRLVSPARRDKALRLKAPDGQRRSLGAALLLEYVFGRSDCETDVRGKPYFPDERPFSLSHSGRYAACAVSDGPVGVDIEKPRAGCARLAERFFAPDERAAVRASENGDAEFTRLWTLKEAYIKAAGLSLADIGGFSVLDGSACGELVSLRCGEYFLGLYGAPLGAAPEIKLVKLPHNKL